MLGALGALVCLLLYLPTATWDYDQVTDTRATAIASWSLAQHGTIQVDTTWPDVPWAQRGPDGNWYVWRHPGGMIWGALFYLPTDLGLEPSSAIEVPYAPATLSAVVATSLGVGVMIMLFRRLVPARTALLAGLVLGLGTSNWSVSADSAWNHGPTLLLLGLGMLAAAQRRYAWSGLAMAVAITVRPHVAVAPLAIGLAAGWRERNWRTVAVIGTVSFLGLLATAWFYDHFFGTPTLRPEQAAAFFSGDVNLTDHGWAMNSLLWFVDLRTGLLVYSPFLLFLLPGVRTAWRATENWVRASAIAALLYAIIQTRADVYHAGFGFFGYRGPLEMLTLAAPLLVVTYQHYIDRQSQWQLATEVSALASVIVFAMGSTGTAPLNRAPHHCHIQRHVGVYRPEKEWLDALQTKLVECDGEDPEEASRYIADIRDALARQGEPA